jgi:hypothetical protein
MRLPRNYWFKVLTKENLHIFLLRLLSNGFLSFFPMTFVGKFYFKEHNLQKNITQGVSNPIKGTKKYQRSLTLIKTKLIIKYLIVRYFK